MRTAIQFSKMGKEERKKNQEWKAKVKYTSGSIMEIIISSFKRLQARRSGPWI